MKKLVWMASLLFLNNKNSKFTKNKIFLVILICVLIAIAQVSSAIPTIVDIAPNNPPALIPVNFAVVLSTSAENLTYSWDFGDGVVETTEIGIAKHAYEEKGFYDLTLIIYNEKGETSNITKTIEIVAPKDYIELIISNYGTDLKNLKNSIEKLPEFLKIEAYKKINITELNNNINEQEGKFNVSNSDDEYIEITNELLKIPISYKIEISQTIGKSEFFQNEIQADLELLNELSNKKAPESREDYTRAVNSWKKENLKVYLEIGTYSLYFRDKAAEPLFSDVKINFEPIQKINNLYFIINENPEKIAIMEFDGETSDKSNAKALIFPEFNKIKEIEFLYPGKINILNAPFYFSPDLNELDFNETVILCNNNEICEKEIGENYKNCRKDCKPFTITITMLIFLILSAFIVYIALQEWYKKHYESKLFSNKNDIYNLMSFMNNSINQGLKKNSMFEKLKKINWNGEQLEYAWKKLNGKRTGMFEIPVFKWFEQRKIQREIESRKGNYIYKYSKH